MTYAMLAVFGVGMWSVYIYCAVYAYRHRNDPPDPHACPECRHEQGLDPRRRHCGHCDDHGGWTSDECHCENDYHWNYESTVIGP